MRLESHLDDLQKLRVTSLDAGDDDEKPEAAAGDGIGVIAAAAAAAASTDDDEEAEEDDAAVTLGFLKTVDRRLLLPHFFSSKAGGLPAWLDPVNLPSGASGSCGFCAQPLQFVLQIYAPIAGKEAAFHRTLFLFMCPSMSCLLKDQVEQSKHQNGGNICRSVKVFRCQLPRNNAFYSSEPPRRDSTDEPCNAGAPLCDWCGTWRADKFCGGCKTARYCSEVHQALHWRSGHRSDCLRISSTSGTCISVRPSTEKVSGGTSWPEYEIIVDDEYAFDSDISDENSSKSVVVSRNDKPDDMVRLWMDQFEADADNKCWASFQERISRAPEQVLRYCREPNAKPLWALSARGPSSDDIPSCRYCRGPLSYEFQIMPQLLYYFHVNNEPDSLDWATIVVYTCQESCDESVGYNEEFPWVQLYPTATRQS